MDESPRIVKDEEELRSNYKAPSDLVLQKCLPRLDGHCRAFIARSPFLCMATADADRSADVSPRGDAPGFVHVVDDRRLLIPDRVGNNRLDSMSNITQNPHVGLIFFVPGVDETLRVNGTALIVRDWTPLEGLTANGKDPHTGILVDVVEAYFQCGKALKRAKLWQPEHHIDPGQLTSFGEVLADQTDTGMSGDELDALIETSYRDRLY